MPLVLGGSAVVIPSGKTACRFSGVAGEYMTRTSSAAAPTLATKSTISFWIKQCMNLANQQMNILYTNGAVSPYFQIQFPNGSGYYGIDIQNYHGGNSNNFITSQSVLDVASWYHVVYSYDSTPATPSTASMQLFLNGVKITSFTTEAYPSQSTASKMTAASVTWPIGKSYDTSTLYPLDGYLAEFMVVDGQALVATDFGEFDGDSPNIWKPKDISGITVGAQGFYLDFADSSDMGKDVGGNGFDYTLTNMDSTNQTMDTPTNNFAILNSMDNYYSGGTFTEGGCKLTTGSSQQTFNTGTIGLSAGKWYLEAKITQLPTSSNSFIGISALPSDATDNYLGQDLYGWGILGQTGWVYNNSASVSYGSGLSLNDVVGWYLDLDNSKLYQAINGVIENSGTGISITAVASTPTGVYFPAFGDYNNASSAIWEVNFGNPVTALTSAVNDVNGYGNFEYSPNDGGSASFDGSAKDFLAICTKNLGSDGG